MPRSKGCTASRRSRIPRRQAPVVVDQRVRFPEDVGPCLHEEIVREAEVDLAGRVQPRELIRPEGEIEAPEVVPQLRDGLRPDDRDDHPERLLADPCKRYLGRGAAGLFRHLRRRLRDPHAPFRDDRFGPRLVFRVPRSGRPVLRGLVLPRQHPSREDPPGRHGDVQRLGHRHQVALRRPVRQAVLDLESGEGAPTFQLGERVRPRHDPRGCVGDPDVEDLPGPHDVVEGPHRLLEGRHPVPGVDPVEVDVVGAQAFQAGVERLHQVLPVVPAAVGIVGAHVQRVFRGEDEPLPPFFQELPHELLAGAVGVQVGGVDEVAARVRERIEDPAALLLRRPPAPLLAERHRPQAQLRHPKARLPQQLVPHRAPPFEFRGNPMIQYR